MPLQFAPSRIATTFAATTRQNIVENGRTQLLAAGWTDVSGSVGDRKLACVATSGASLQCRVRLRDPGSGNTARITIMDTGELRVSQDFYLKPAASKNYAIYANQHQFMLIGDDVLKDFFACGVPYLESFLYGVPRGITEAIWAQGNMISDTDSASANCFLTRSSLEDSQWAWQSLNGNAWGGSTVGPGSQRLLAYTQEGDTTVGELKYHSGNVLRIPARILWRMLDSTARATINGQLWDAAMLFSSAGTIKTFDSHDWIKIGADITDLSKPSLWIATT